MPAMKTDTFIDEICAIPGGEDIKVCIQCGTCTASCPNADRMEHVSVPLNSHGSGRHARGSTIQQ